MTDPHHLVDRLRRPRLLMQAARFGQAEYRRSPAIRRLLAGRGAQSAIQIVLTLLGHEADLEARRCAGEASYSPSRHVEALTALVAEARRLPRATRRPLPQPKASGMADLRCVTCASSASRMATSSAGAS